MRKIKRQIAKLMVAVMISTLLSSVFSSVAYANEISDLTSEMKAPADENAVIEEGENATEQTGAGVPAIAEELQEYTADGKDESEKDVDKTGDAVEETQEPITSENETSEKEAPENEISETETSENETSEESENETTKNETSEDNGEDENSQPVQEKLSEEVPEKIDKEEIDEEEITEEAFEEIKEEGKTKSGKKNGSGNDELTESMNGWVEDGDGTYFYRDGEKVCDEIVEFDGKSYYFDYNGCLTKNSFFYTDYNSEGYPETIYYFGEDGSLLTGGWQGGCYFGVDGKAYLNGIYSIDEKDYYFDEWGEVQVDTVVKVDDKNYYIDSDGNLYETPENGWFEQNGNRFYLENGFILKNCVKLLDDGFYYGFAWDGRMYDDQSFSCGDYYDEDEECWVSYRYRAKPGGRLYENEWYLFDERLISYYGEGGRAYINGIYSVDGKDYYFDEWGDVKFNAVVKVDDKSYYIDSEGNFYETPENGWFKRDGDYYYFENGSMLRECVKLLDDGYYYGFDWDGKREEDVIFYLNRYDNETGRYLGDDFYVAGADGKLVRNDWYRDPNTNQLISYHGDDCKGYRNGFYEIDGKTYYFDNVPSLFKNTTATIDGVNYFFDKNGVAICTDDYNGWFESDDDKYYYENGTAIKESNKKIGDSWYYFDSNGRLWRGGVCSTGVYDEDNNYIGYIEYMADADGKLYTNRWYYSTYYGSDGKSCRDGIFEIDGVNYLFDAYSDLLTNYAGVYNGKAYISDRNGVASVIAGDGWHEVNGCRYYFTDGDFVRNQRRVIDGIPYFFTNGGTMLDNRSYGIWDEGDSSCYIAKPGGELYTNEWKKDGNAWYFFGDDSKALLGLVTIDNEKYYFGEGGILLRGGCITADGKNYIADKDGVLTEVTEEGWQEKEGNKYYIKDGKYVKGGTLQIGDEIYLFDYNGKLLINSSMVYWEYDYDKNKNVCIGYYSDSSGKILRSTWCGGKDYYAGADGKLYVDGIYSIDGKDYYFSEYGYLSRNTVATVGNDTYLADGSGRAFKVETGSLTETSTGTYYVFDDYIVRNAVVSVGGVNYAFDRDGRLMKNSVTEYRKKAYLVNESGVATQAPEGEVKIGNDTYFVRDGMLVREGIVEINGDAYAFDSNGKMIKASGFTIRYRSSTSNDFDPYEQPASGNSSDPYEFYEHYSMDLATYRKMSSGNNELPYDASSNAYNPYMSGADGKLLRNTWFHDVAFDLWSYFDETCRKVAGWNVIDGKTYYMDRFGIRQSGWMEYKGKKRYLGDDDGVMRTGWLSLGQKKYYFDEEGFMQTGWIELDGKKYYMNAEGVMQTGTVEIDGQAYSFDDNGVLITGSGWITSDGKTYYLDTNGEKHTGWLDHEGKRYYMDPDGVMQTAAWITDGGKKYHLDNAGVLETNCWVTDGSKTYHVNKNGAMQVDCLLNVDGTYYRLKTTGVLLKNSFYTLGSYRYFFGDDGVRKENCWFTHEGKTYYAGEKGIIKKNTAFTDKDGKMYAINSSGVMQKNGKSNMIAKAGSKRYVVNKNGVIQLNGWKTVDGKKYYAGKDGAIVKKDWVVVGSKKYHVDKDGVMETGWVKISKKWYYFTPKTGVMVYGKTLTIDGKKYKFDKNGVCTNK